jgi:hypothetical protein
VRFYLKRYAAEPLMRMLIESEDRWEKRDAATALLKLQLTQVCGCGSAVLISRDAAKVAPESSACCWEWQHV